VHKVVVKTTIRLRFDRYDYSTTIVTTGLLHCGLNNKKVSVTASLADYVTMSLMISRRMAGESKSNTRVWPGFFIGSRQDRRTEGRERGVVLGRGSNPSPPARGSGKRCELSSGVRVRRSPDCPKVFHYMYFQHSGWPLM